MKMIMTIIHSLFHLLNYQVFDFKYVDAVKIFVLLDAFIGTFFFALLILIELLQLDHRYLLNINSAR